MSGVHITPADQEIFDAVRTCLDANNLEPASKTQDAQTVLKQALPVVLVLLAGAGVISPEAVDRLLGAAGLDAGDRATLLTVATLLIVLVLAINLSRTVTAAAQQAATWRQRNTPCLNQLYVWAMNASEADLDCLAPVLDKVWHDYRKVHGNAPWIDRPDVSFHTLMSFVPPMGKHIMDLPLHQVRDKERFAAAVMRIAQRGKVVGSLLEELGQDLTKRQRAFLFTYPIIDALLFAAGLCSLGWQAFKLIAT